MLKIAIFNYNPILLKVLTKLEKLNLPSQYGGNIPFVKTADNEEAAGYGLDQEADLPKIILFENGIPEVYDGGMIRISVFIFFALYFKSYIVELKSKAEK